MERLLEAVKVIVSGVWSHEPLWKMRFSEGIYKKHQNDQNEINVLLYQVMKCLLTLSQITGYILFGTILSCIINCYTIIQEILTAAFF